MQYIFLDTFALSQLTKDYYKKLNDYLERYKLHIVISATQLIEYYSPIIQTGDRTSRAIQLLAVNLFVIVDQEDIYHEEEENYPQVLPELPFRLKSESLFVNLDIVGRMAVLRKMLHEGITESGFNLKEWVSRYHATKSSWSDSVNSIITNSQDTHSIESKDKFVQSLDLRFCDKILNAIDKLDKPSEHDKTFKTFIRKLADMQERNDNWRLRGIHLSSLIFWYEYIIAKKKIHDSDMADIFHAMIFPYCSVVVTDASRVDCLQQIQRKEQKYQEVQFLNIKNFIIKLIH